MASLRKMMIDNEAALDHKKEQVEKKQVKERKRKSRLDSKNIGSVFQTLPLDERKKYSELVQIVPDGRGYTAYQRIDAIFAYFVEGSIRGAARLIGISEGTILSWAQSSWWKTAMMKIRELKQDELDTQYTSIIDKTVTEIVDRLSSGDEQILRDGTPIRKRVGAKDLMLINAMAFDKRALLRGNATSISEKIITVDDRNKILAEQFRSIARGQVINGELEDNAGKAENDEGNESAVRDGEGEGHVLREGDEGQEETIEKEVKEQEEEITDL